MISLRILCWRIPRVNLRLPASANFTSVLQNNRYMSQGNIDRRLHFVSLRYYGTDPATPLTEDQEASLKPADIQHQKCVERDIRERSTVQFMMETMLTLGFTHLLDKEFKKANKLYSCKAWEKEDSCYNFWIAILENSRTPSALELKDKVTNLGIPYEDFCQSMVKVYFTLRECYDPVIPGEYVTPEDVKDTIKRLEFNRTQNECLKILFSINKIYGMKI